MLFSHTIGNHDEARPLASRTCIRGIILDETGKAAMITTRQYGDMCFPGGGMDRGESDAQALAREMREETGCIMDMSSPVLFGQVRLFKPDRDVPGGDYFQLSRYYFCRAESWGEPELSASEQREGVSLVWIEPEKAIKINNRLADRKLFWLDREQAVLERLCRLLERYGAVELCRRIEQGSLETLTGGEYAVT